MLSKSTHLCTLGFMMITSTIQTTKTAQAPSNSFLQQFNLVTIPAIKQTVLAVLQDYENNYKNYAENATIIHIMLHELQNQNPNRSWLTENLDKIQKTNNRFTPKLLLKRQRYLQRKIDAIKEK